MTGDIEETEDAFDDEEFPALAAIGRLEEVIQRVPWFSRLGQPLDADIAGVAQRYLDMLGFPDATPVPVEDWLEAEIAAESHDLNSEGWEVEEALRADLSREALELTDEAMLTDALARVSQIASSVAMDAAANVAAMWAIDDDSIIDVAVGHAVQGCYQAGLVLAAQAVEDHPFALRFRLFEAGRWPIALTGRSFQIF